MPNDRRVSAESATPGRAATGGSLVEVEALRGVAILLVFLYHCDAVVRPDAHGAGPLFAFVRAGHSGVSLFFVLSGFLLSQPFLAEAAGGRRVRRREYFFRRALRILPAYYLALLVALCWSTPLPDWPAIGWPFALILPVLAPQFSLWPFSIGWWSLSTEVQFSVLLPLLAVVARTRPRAATAFAVYVLFYLLFLLAVVRLPTLHQDLWLLSNVFGRSPLFLSGIAAAILWRSDGPGLRARLARVPWLRAGGGDALLLLLLATLSLLLQWAARVGFWAAELRPNGVWHVAEGLLWASVLLVTLLCPLRGRRLLVNPILAWVGQVSYSLFLIHVPVVAVALSRFKRWDAESVLASGALLALCLLLSTITYWTVERPFLVRKAKLTR